MATWTPTSYLDGTNTAGHINIRAPIPSSRYQLIKGMSWNRSKTTQNARAIFHDIYGYAVKESATSATLYLCQRGWIYHKMSTNYATNIAINTFNDNIYSTGTSSGFMWGYSTYATFSITGSSTVSMDNIYYGSNNANHGIYSSSVTNGGRIYLDNTGRAWYRITSQITGIPINSSTTNLVLNFGAVTGTGGGDNYFEVSGAWSATVPLLAKTTRVIFDCNGGAKNGDSQPVTAGDYTKFYRDMTLDTTANSEMYPPARNGCAFLGWYTTASGGSQVYRNQRANSVFAIGNTGYWGYMKTNAAISATPVWQYPGETLTLYAHWGSANIVYTNKSGTWYIAEEIYQKSSDAWSASGYVCQKVNGTWQAGK